MEKGNSAKLPQKGVYTLIIKVAKEIRIRIGSLGLQKFREGYYAYTGSALGASATSLKNRVRRHLRKAGKKKRWHIDFLLADEHVQIETIIAASTSQKKECEINKKVKKVLKAEALVPKFGASDCKNKCVSHLLYLGGNSGKKAIEKIYVEIAGEAIVIDPDKLYFPKTRKFHG